MKKKTLLTIFLMVCFLLVLGVCIAYADVDISVTGVDISNGSNGTDVNYDDATVSLSGTTITVSGVLDDMESFASSNPSQGSGKWVGILITTNQASITSLYYKSDNASYATYSQLTQADIDEAVQMGASGTSTFILWIKAEEVASADKTFSLASDASGTGEVSYTVEFVDQVNVSTSLTNIVSSNTAERVTKGAAYSTTLSAASGYSLPAAITITVGGSTLSSGTDYTYSQSTGALSIPSAKVSGDIAINGAGVATPELTGLSLVSSSESYLSSSFSANTYLYYLEINEDENYLYLYPSFDSSAYDLEVSYSTGSVTDYFSSSGYYRIAVNTAYLSDILVTVTSKADGTVFTTYTLDLSAVETTWDVDMKIKGDDGVTYLTTSEFDPEDTGYTLDLDDDVETLYLYVYFDDDDYSLRVRYDGSTISKESSTSTYYLYEFDVDTDDLEDLTVKVTDEDDSSNYETYTFSLDGDSGTDALEDIHLNVGTTYKTSSSYAVDVYPSFDSDITDYVALIPYDDDYENDIDLYLRLTLEDDDVDLEYEGSDISLSSDYYSDTFSVDEGDYEDIDFSVEGVDYSIRVYYADEDADDDAYLDDLAVRSQRSTSASYELDLSPSFDEDETEYSLADADDYSTLYVYPEADSDMIILVNDEYLSGSYCSFDPDDYDEITITVFAENLDDSEEYTIDLDGSSNSLSSLYVYSGTYSSILLSPSFSSSAYNYVASVDNSVFSVTLKFSASSTVKIAKDSGSYVTKSSGTSYSLNVGLNEFDIQVGSTHYYLNIYRQSSTLSVVPSTQYISIDGGSKITIPAFNINGNNFVKLRSVAYLLSGTDKQFSVTYTAATNLITLRSDYSYASIGGELTVPSSYTKAVASSQIVYLDGSYVYPTAYNIDGYNYFLLRDLAALFDFEVEYSGTTVYIDTDKSYGGDDDSSSSDFDVDMKLLGDEGTYLSTSTFDPDDNSYDVEIDEEEETLDLYVYFDDDDYTVKVKYDGSTVSKDSSSSTYYRYEIDVDTDDLEEITVTVTNDDGDKEVYTLYLDVE